MFNSEGEKVKPKILDYLVGDILDIGAGPFPITKEADTVDFYRDAKYKLSNDREVYYLHNILTKCYDTVFSSHLVEHLFDPGLFIKNLELILKPAGNLILVLPDTRYYKRDVENVDHLHSFTYECFLRWFKCGFNSTYEIIKNGTDFGEDRYSFYVIARKK